MGYILNLNSLPGAIPNEELISLINKEINEYQTLSQNFVFILMTLTFKEKSSSQEHQNDIFVKVSSIINKIAIAKKGAYSIERNGKIILFLPKSESEDCGKIVKVINDALPEHINLKAGLAEFPKDAISFSSLYDIALTTLNTYKNTDYLEYTNVFEWKENIDRSINTIESNVKSVLFKEIAKTMQNISQYDAYLAKHSALVAQGSILFAKELGLPWSKIEKIAISAILHDIGYTAIPKQVYNKASGLTQEEWQTVKLHPTIACEYILNSSSLFTDYLDIIQNHHEYIDGSGYPNKVKGDNIPFESQIISIVDSYQAMNIDRPHRKALDFDQIIDVYISNSGKKWDEELVTIFCAIIAEPSRRQEFTEIKNLSQNFNSVISR